MEWLNGMVEWNGRNGGMEWWNGKVEWNGGMNGIVECVLLG